MDKETVDIFKTSYYDDIKWASQQSEAPLLVFIVTGGCIKFGGFLLRSCIKRVLFLTAAGRFYPFMAPALCIRQNAGSFICAGGRAD